MMDSLVCFLKYNNYLKLPLYFLLPWSLGLINTLYRGC